MLLFEVLLCGLLLHHTLAEIPDCDYIDTVDLSDSLRLPNGSYIYKGLLIPDRLTGKYEYMPDNSRESVNRHWRGCACKLRACVRFCCRPDQIMNNGECQDTKEKELAQIDPYLNVTRVDGSVVKRHFHTELILQTDFPLPCSSYSLYHLDNRKESDTYTLYDNETLLIYMDNEKLNKYEYCFQHTQLDAKDPKLRIVPHYCSKKPNTEKVALSIVMILSLVCMILTIGVYLFFTKLHRNLHGKSFICYMVCLFIGHLLLLLDMWELTWDFCYTTGFLGYFFLMACYFWLSVISLHLWKKLGNSSISDNQLLPNYQFLVFNAFAFGMATILTVIVYQADTFDTFNLDNVNPDWMPRIGYYTCWINTYDWSAMLYLYGPMLVLISFNMIMFILTAIRIVAVKKELRKFAQLQKRKKLNSEKQTYILFLRLFIIMGMPWSLEIISYLMQNYEFSWTVLKVAKYCVKSQGIFIFVLFVLKRSTIKLIMKR